MSLRIEAVLVCLIVVVCVRADSSSSEDTVNNANQHSANGEALLTSFQSRSKAGDPDCTFFNRAQMTESQWPKNSEKADISVGKQTNQPVRIADIKLKVKNHNWIQHTVRLCTIDARKTDYVITGYKIKSIGDDDANATVLYPTVFGDGVKQLVFNARSQSKGKDMELTIDVYGKNQGTRLEVPVATCVNPRKLKLKDVKC